MLSQSADGLWIPARAGMTTLLEIHYERYPN
jgi:hypothetical protein